MRNILKALVIVALVIMTSCAMLPVRKQITNPWIPIEKNEVIFASQSKNGALRFARIEEVEKGKVTTLMHIAKNGDTVAGVIKSENEIVNGALLIVGKYNSEKPKESLPILVGTTPRPFSPNSYPMIQQDLNTILKLWETRKHISRTEMDNVVEEFFSFLAETSARHYPSGEDGWHYPTDST